MEEVLGLLADERIGLVDRILASCLNLPTRPGIHRLWEEETERRGAEDDIGAVKPIPGEKVFAKIHGKYAV